MNKQLRKLHVTAKDIGYCLVCGGSSEKCNCASTSAPVQQPIRQCVFHEHKEPKHADPATPQCHLFCVHCWSITTASADLNVVRCECGSILKHVFTEPVIPEPDYSILEGVTELPRHALRKPRI